MYLKSSVALKSVAWHLLELFWLRRVRYKFPRLLRRIDRVSVTAVRPVCQWIIIYTLLSRTTSGYFPNVIVDSVLFYFSKYCLVGRVAVWPVV